MSHWNYRVMKRLNSDGEHEYGIYEVYYDDNNNILGWTENSLTPVCYSEDGLLHELELMKEALKKETLIYEQK